MKFPFKRKTAFQIFSLALLAFVFPGCQGTEASATEEDAAGESDSGWFSALTPKPETITVPAGDKIYVRLDHNISTAQHKSGDPFTATAERAIEVEGKVVIPAGAQAKGRIVHADDSDRVKGRAELKISLNEVIIDGESYALKTQALSFRAKGTQKKDAKIIGGGAALGAIVGAIAGGGDGAAKGAAIGAGSGTGVVLATRGEEVEFGAETVFAFTLAESVGLPAR